MPNTNFQTFHQMGSAISNVVKQATGRNPVENIDMDYVTVAQNKTIGEMVISGNPASFHTGNAVQIQRLLIGMNPIQSGSGDPSPSNVRSITGWTGLNVTRCGKNLFPPLSSETKNGVTISVADDGTVTINGTASADTFFDKDVPSYQVRVGDTYSIYGFNPVASSSNRLTLFIITTSGNPQLNMNSANAAYSLVSTSAGTITRYRLRVPSGVEYTNFIVKPLLCINSIVTEYEPYSGTTIPVTFPDPPGTVYQGTLNLISGQLTVTHLMQTFTGAESEEWLNTYESNGFRIASRGMKVALLNTGLCNWLPILSEVGNEMGVALGMNDSDIYVRHITDNLEIADLTEWKAYLAEHPLEIFYPLEPAQYYQVTPQDLNTLAGDNVIMTDADTLEVMYYQMGEVI